MQIAKIIILCFFILSLQACTSPYDSDANAQEDLNNGIANLNDHKFLLVVFGANWCKDCIVLDNRLHEPPLNELISTNFDVVKIDVGYWDKNLDVIKSFGDPISNGIPSIAIVDKDGRVRHLTTGGEFASIRKQSVSSTRDYLKTVLTNLGPQKI